MKVTVQKAYMGGKRVLADSNGRVFAFKVGWVEPEEPVTLVSGEPYENWRDVPIAWCGFVPYWSSCPEAVRRIECQVVEFRVSG